MGTLLAQPDGCIAVPAPRGRSPGGAAQELEAGHGTQARAERAGRWMGKARHVQIWLKLPAAPVFQVKPSKSCKPRCGDTAGADRPYQNTLPWLQAPEGTLRVDLVGEFPFHEDALAAPLQHRYANRATADIHRHLGTQRERK